MLLKRRKRDKGKLLRLQGVRGGQGEDGALVVGWAGVVVWRLVQLRRYVYNAN